MRLAVSLLAVAVLSGGTPLSPARAATLPAQEKQSEEEESPFVGLWEANLSKSKRDPNHQFQRATLRFAVDGDVVTLTHGGINASGHEEGGETTLVADGQEHESPEAPGIVVVTSWRGPRVLESVARRDGEVAGQGIYEISADGTTLIATVSGTDAGGRAFQQVIVFDRE